jgi:inner membrane protein
MGLKLLLVCGLALLMSIPALYVGRLVEERAGRAAEVVRDISEHVGGQQTFLGPTLAIPYTTGRGVYLVFPANASGTVRTTTEVRRRSLFKVPVFQADLNLDATFDLTGVPAMAPHGAELDWSRAEIVVGVSNPRGALADVKLWMDGKTSTLIPAALAPDICVGRDPGKQIKLTQLGQGWRLGKTECATSGESGAAILGSPAAGSAGLWQDDASGNAGRLGESRI